MKKTQWLTIRVTPEEYKQVQTLATQTTCPNLSEYARKSVLGKPVIMRYRNQSLDEFVTEMLLLRKELNRIGTNINQSVHRLHTLSRAADIDHWILVNEQDKTELFRQIDLLQQKIADAYKLWSQE
jgi:hypothetical protein